MATTTRHRRQPQRHAVGLPAAPPASAPGSTAAAHPAARHSPPSTPRPPSPPRHPPPPPPPRPPRIFSTTAATTFLLSLFLLLLRTPHAGSYEVYEDEYVNRLLPGHEGDQRGLPNLPFTVDTNRQSDGISTVSPLTMTSPSLPYYTESAFFDEFGVTSVEHRRTHFHRTRHSQEEQGIAERGAGEAAREDAAYKRVKEGRLDYFPNVTFGVHAGTRWNPSAFAVQADETYQVEVRGAQDWIDGLTLTMGYQ